MTKLYKTLFIVISTIMISYTLNGQGVMKVGGTPCIGVVNTYVFTGSCSSISWSATGNYTWVQRDNNQARIIWNGPGNVSVTAYTSGCQGSSGGSHTSPSQTITSPPNPSASISPTSVSN